MANRRTTRTIRKLEKPKPLKHNPASRHSSLNVPVSSVEDILQLLDTVSSAISRKVLSEKIPYYTSTLIAKMKIFGQKLEESYKDKLDKAFSHFRNGSIDDSIHYGIRINLLHLIELRAMQWTESASVSAYYVTKCSIPEVSDSIDASPVSTTNVLLGPGEIIKSSGRYSSPTKVPGKNYFRDEVVIRNSDSGKVSPGAKERNVQITGPDEEKIVVAKQLIEDTVKRNVSPRHEVEKDRGSNSSLSSASVDSTLIGANNSVAGMATTRTTRAIKKLEKPKPLKHNPASRHSSLDVPGQVPVSSAEDILQLLDTVSSAISRKVLSEEIAYYTSTLIAKMKIFGQRLEESYKDKLDKAFSHFRNGSKDDSIDYGIRINLLQLIELRAMQWTVSASVSAYYVTKCSIPEVSDSIDASPLGNTNVLLGPGEIIKSSGRYSSPTKVPGKNYFRDEVVIRNSDSGKVSPGAKERNVQITGPDEEKIIVAKQLIEDTIKRNASPIREVEKDRGSNSSLSSASDDSTLIGANNSGKVMTSNCSRDAAYEYKHSVVAAGKTIKLSSNDHDLLKWAKLALETEAKRKESDVSHATKETQVPEFTSNKVGSSFAEQSVVRAVNLSNDSELGNELKNESTKTDVNEKKCVLQKRRSVKIRQYTRDFLLDLSCNNSATKPPPKWDEICLTYPNIVKQGSSYFDAVLYSKKWLESEGKPVPIIDAYLDYYDSE